MILEAWEGMARAGLLHLVRILAALWIVPVFGSDPPARLQRLGVALAVGYATIAARGLNALEDPGSDVVLLGLLAGKELLFGIVLGWTAALVFEAVRIAGALIATEMGLNMANQVDPVTRSSQPLLAHLFQIMAFVLFFLAGGHAIVLGALVRSFEAVPPGSFALNEEILSSILQFTGSMIGAAIRMAGPVFVLLILLTLCVGLLAKVAPNLHIIEASYPIRILGAFVLLVIFLPNLLGCFDSIIEAMGLEIFTMASAASGLGR